jgi:hypothetical protein
MSLTRLTNLDFWPQSAAKKLADRWIDTAVQVVSVARTSDGLDSLALQAGLSNEDMAKLIELTKLSLSSEDEAALRTDLDTVEMGLGAQRPKGGVSPKKRE